MPFVNVELSQDQINYLERKARREDTTIEAYLSQFVHRLAMEGRDEESRLARDPMFRLAPAYGSGIADLSTQHDHYLYGSPKR